MARAGKEKQKEEKDKYHQWKQNIPIMYDWILNHSLTWPSQSCRWAARRFAPKCHASWKFVAKKQYN